MGKFMNFNPTMNNLGMQFGPVDAYEYWVSSLNRARQAPNGALFRHMESMNVQTVIRNYARYVDYAVQGLAFVERKNGMLQIPEIELYKMNAFELKQLYDIVNHHAITGGNDRPENGAIAREIESYIKKEIITLVQTDFVKALEVFQDQSPTFSDITSLKDELGNAITAMSNQFPGLLSNPQNDRMETDNKLTKRSRSEDFGNI